MTSWFDWAVYSALSAVMWFVLPAANARFVRGIVAERNAAWLENHPAVAAVLSGRRLPLACYGLGALSLALLLAVQAGAWPRALSAPALEPEHWMVLADVNAALVGVWLTGAATAAVRFNRWLERDVPLAERRQASLERRSIDAFVPRGVQVVVYGLVTLHLGTWVAFGWLRGYATAAFWGNAAFQVVIAAVFLVIARRIALRKPNALDRSAGEAFRRAEVRCAFVAQLLPLLNGAMRLYEHSGGVIPDDAVRASHLGVVTIVILAGVLSVVRNAHRRRGPLPAAALKVLTGIVVIAGAVVMWPAVGTAQAPPAAAASDADIRAILQARVDVHHQALGIVVGIVDPAGRRIVTYGRRATGDDSPLDGDTMFEIGSVTKAFTSLLLADAVRRGEVALNDPVAKYLPPTVKVPERNGRMITLVDLATHTSGLPREPTNLQPRDPANPFADYTAEQLYAFLSGYQLTRDIGVEFDYSNLGAGLLGHVLTRRTGLDFDTLVRRRIAAPLAMAHTGATIPAALGGRLARGHNRLLEPIASWHDSPVYAGAGALRSSVNDMLTFLAAAMGERESALAPAFAVITATRRPTASPVVDATLGWAILKQHGTEVVWANGRTGGYRSWAGYEPRTRRGVVVLTNTDGAMPPDDIGLHLLNPAFPLARAFPPPPVRRSAVTIDPALVDRYVGRYQFAPAVALTVTREGDRFYIQLTGQPPAEMFPESASTFFLKAADVQLTFDVSGAGNATAVVLRQNGVEQRAPRADATLAVPREVTLDAAVLDGYVGRYQFAPGLTVTITRQSERMLAQVSGQPPVEIFASDTREFFYKVINARLTFEVDDRGRATAVVLQQGGRDQRASRVE